MSDQQSRSVTVTVSPKLRGEQFQAQMGELGKSTERVLNEVGSRIARSTAGAFAGMEQDIARRLQAVGSKLGSAGSPSELIGKKAREALGFSTLDRQVDFALNRIKDKMRSFDLHIGSGNMTAALRDLTALQRQAGALQKTVGGGLMGSLAGFEHAGGGIMSLARGVAMLNGEGKNIEQVIGALLKLQGVAELWSGGKALTTGLISGVTGLRATSRAMAQVRQMQAALRGTSRRAAVAMHEEAGAVRNLAAAHAEAATQARAHGQAEAQAAGASRGRWAGGARGALLGGGLAAIAGGSLSDIAIGGGSSLLMDAVMGGGAAGGTAAAPAAATTAGTAATAAGGMGIMAALGWTAVPIGIGLAAGAAVDLSGNNPWSRGGGGKHWYGDATRDADTGVPALSDIWTHVRDNWNPWSDVSESIDRRARREQVAAAFRAMRGTQLETTAPYRERIRRLGELPEQLRSEGYSFEETGRRFLEGRGLDDRRERLEYQRSRAVSPFAMPDAVRQLIGQGQQYVSTALTASSGSASSAAAVQKAYTEEKQALLDQERITSSIVAKRLEIAAKGREAAGAAAELKDLEQQSAKAAERVLAAKRGTVEAARAHAQAEVERLDKLRGWASEQEKFFRGRVDANADQTMSLKEKYGLMSPSERAALGQVAKHLAENQLGAGVANRVVIGPDGRPKEIPGNPGMPLNMLQFAQSHSDFLGDLLRKRAVEAADRDTGQFNQILRDSGLQRKFDMDARAAKAFGDIKINLDQKIKAEVEINAHSIAQQLADQVAPQITAAINALRTEMDAKLDTALKQMQAAGLALSGNH